MTKMKTEASSSTCDAHRRRRGFADRRRPRGRPSTDEPGACVMSPRRGRPARLHGRRRIPGRLRQCRPRDRCCAVATVGRRTGDRREVRPRLGRGHHARRDRGHPGRPRLVGGPRSHRMDGDGSAPARPCAGPHVVSGRRGDQDRRRRDQRRADLSGPPAWIVGRPIDTDCEGTVEEPDQEGHRRGGRHQPVGGIPTLPDATAST